MKVTLTLKDNTQMVICDGDEATSKGMSALSRGMMLQGLMGLQQPNGNAPISLVFSIGVSKTFATEQEASEFRLLFPAQLPTGEFGVKIEASGNPIEYGNATIQSLNIEQNEASCVLAYSFKASMA